MIGNKYSVNNDTFIRVLRIKKGAFFCQVFSKISDLLGDKNTVGSYSYTPKQIKSMMRIS